MEIFRGLALFWALVSVIAAAETIDDKVFLQGRATGETHPLGVELALAAPPFFPTSRTLILPVLYSVNEGVKLNAHDAVTIRQFEPGFVLTHTLSPRWDILVTQYVNWRKISGASFSWGKEVSASGVYTLAYYPRDDQRFFYLIGFLFTNDGYRNQFLPALAVVYESEDRSRYFELGSPYSNLLFRPWEHWELGLGAQIRSAYFHVASGTYSSQDARAEFLNLQSLTIGPTFAREVAENLWAHFKIGAELFRSAEQWDADYGVIAGSRVNYPATWYVKAGIGLRFLDDRKR